MAFSPLLFRLYASDLAEAVHGLARERQERLMSVEVKGLADIVRQAKEAVALASSAGPKLRDSAQRVVDKVSQVNDMIKQLDAADADLGAAIGAMSNGGPPLTDTETPSSNSPAEATVNLVKYPKFS